MKKPRRCLRGFLFLPDLSDQAIFLPLTPAHRRLFVR